MVKCMAALLFYDCETTDLPLWSTPSDGPDQPYIMQLTALLTDQRGQKLSSMDVLVQPPDPEWKISDEALATHGILTVRCVAGGIEMTRALGFFLEMWSRAQLRIGHVESFDARMIRIEMKRHPELGDPDVWKSGPAFCTAKESVKIVNLPPSEKMMAAGRKTPKQPSLAEAYQHFTGKELLGSHNAMVDVLACKTVYFALKERAA